MKILWKSTVFAVLRESSETMPFHKISTQKIRWNFGILRSGIVVLFNQALDQIIPDTRFSRLMDMIFNSAENGKYAGMVLIDLQETFDNLHNRILLDKLKCIGLSVKTMKWFYSYRTNRASFVSLDNLLLEAGTKKCIVSQGSLLRPLLFLYTPVCKRH